MASDGGASVAEILQPPPDANRGNIKCYQGLDASMIRALGSRWILDRMVSMSSRTFYKKVIQES